MNQQTRNILFMAVSIAVIIGAAMPLFMLKMRGFHTFMPSEPQVWLFADSHSVTKGKFATKIYHIETFSSLLVASSYFMFKEDPDWIMLLTVAAVLQLYTSILIPRVSKKEENKLLPTSPCRAP